MLYTTHNTTEHAQRGEKGGVVAAGTKAKDMTRGPTTDRRTFLLGISIAYDRRLLGRDSLQAAVSSSVCYSDCWHSGSQGSERISCIPDRHSPFVSISSFCSVSSRLRFVVVIQRIQRLRIVVSNNLCLIRKMPAKRKFKAVLFDVGGVVVGSPVYHL